MKVLVKARPAALTERPSHPLRDWGALYLAFKQKNVEAGINPFGFTVSGVADPRFLEGSDDPSLS